MSLSADQITTSLHQFKSRRDTMLHEDANGFHYHLQRFVEFCERDQLVQLVLTSLQSHATPDDAWWQNLQNNGLNTPSEPDAELTFLYAVMVSAAERQGRIMQFGLSMRKFKVDEQVELFRSWVIKPVVEELSHRIGIAANLATQEERILQAVPLDRIPRSNETRIFLSHKSADKPTVNRYYEALKELGFSPWLDEPDMPAGVNLERGILKGFEESCAAVFFITEHFRDEQYLATEVDYAIREKRKKGNKFAIITLKYPDNSIVPSLLTSYVYKPVTNDLQGLREIVRALPIELNRVLWRTQVIS